jgi:hypothetical protein
VLNFGGNMKRADIYQIGIVEELVYKRDRWVALSRIRRENTNISAEEAISYAMFMLRVEILSLRKEVDSVFKKRNTIQNTIRKTIEKLYKK